jgi:uncharacterized membrane protein SpoIIM required for sporulation
MNLKRFLEERGPGWDELRALTSEARRKPERLGPERVRRIGELYRAAAADLAFARRSFPGDAVVERLEALVGGARHLVYDAPTSRASVPRFFATDYWRLVASRPLPLLIAALCLFGPAGLAGTWALRDPGAAAGLVPGEYHSVTEPRPSGDLGLSAEEEAHFSSEIFTNNIRVSFFAFAAGIALGIGSAVLLAFNGLLLGGVAGLAVEAGNGRSFFELVTAHGVLELSCIVVAGAAGMRLGWAIVEPGRGSRTDALVAEARRAVAVIVGTIPWFVLAGLVEGFVTPEGIGLGGVVAVGVLLAAVYWALVVWRGWTSARTARESSLAGTP